MRAAASGSGVACDEPGLARDHGLGRRAARGERRREQLRREPLAVREHAVRVGRRERDVPGRTRRLFAERREVLGQHALGHAERARVLHVAPGDLLG